MFPSPDSDALGAVNDIDPEDFPRFARAVHDRDPPRVDDLWTAAADVLDEIEEIAALYPVWRSASPPALGGSTTCLYSACYQAAPEAVVFV